MLCLNDLFCIQYLSDPVDMFGQIGLVKLVVYRNIKQIGGIQIVYFPKYF